MYYLEGSRHKNRWFWARKFKVRSNYKVKKLVILCRDKIIKCKYILYVESMEKMGANFCLAFAKAGMAFTNLAEAPLFAGGPVMTELNAINVPFHGERGAHGRTRDVGL